MRFKHRLQTTEFGCIKASIEMVINRDLPNLPEPYCFDTFNDFLIDIGRPPIVYRQAAYALKRFDGVLFLTHGHAVAWSAGEKLCYDPNGGMIQNLPEYDFFMAILESNHLPSR